VYIHLDAVNDVDERESLLHVGQLHESNRAIELEETGFEDTGDAQLDRSWSGSDRSDMGLGNDQAHRFSDYRAKFFGKTDTENNSRNLAFSRTQSLDGPSG